ncbi:MAG: hypothetical protein ACLRXB_15950 [Escherichia coli]
MLINYMALVGEAQDVRTLVHGLAQRVPQQGEELMTLAEELRRDALHVAKAMLQRGFDLQLIMEMTGLSGRPLSIAILMLFPDSVSGSA